MAGKPVDPTTWRAGTLVVSARGNWAILLERKTPGLDTPEWLPGWWVTNRTDGQQTGGIADEVAVRAGWMPFDEFCATIPAAAGAAGAG